MQSSMIRWPFQGPYFRTHNHIIHEFQERHLRWETTLRGESCLHKGLEFMGTCLLPNKQKRTGRSLLTKGLSNSKTLGLAPLFAAISYYFTASCLTLPLIGFHLPLIASNSNYLTPVTPNCRECCLKEPLGKGHLSVSKYNSIRIYKKS
jgi:hypothetical protein